MTKRLHITERQMIKEVEQYLKQYDDADSVGERSDAACKLIVQVAIWGGKNHYEAIGILQEAQSVYRETSLTILNEENEN